MTNPTSMGSHCSRNPVSLLLRSWILEPNVASRYVTISRRARVRKRLGLRISDSRTFPALTLLGANQFDLVVDFIFHDLFRDVTRGFQRCSNSRLKSHKKQVSSMFSGGMVVSFRTLSLFQRKMPLRLFWKLLKFNFFRT